MKRIRDLIDKGVDEGTFPGAVLLVAHRGHVDFFERSGFRSIIPRRLPMEKDTVFDLASLTKPLATTLGMMKLVEEGLIDLEQPLDKLLQTVPLRDKRALTPRLLLSHSAGLADWKPFYMKLVQFPPEFRKGILREQIIDLPFAYSPGTACLYSDLGYMLLEWITEERTGEPMASFLGRSFYDRMSIKKTFLGSENRPEGIKTEQFAATEDCPWRGKILRGEVHDENAYALGGYSGHAGLFGTAEEVFAVANVLREHYRGERDDFFSEATVREFFRKQNIVKDCTFALGWDTPSSENSSAGVYFSEHSVGHLGFTGTSLWMDLEKDVIVIFLTNRVHPTRENEKIRAFRPLIHDTVMETLGLN